MAERIDWQSAVLPRAKQIVESYDTGVTLRQLFYRLVAEGQVPNLKRRYTYLSEQTAEGRRDGSFPHLVDRTSRIEEPGSFTGPEEAREWIRDQYRRDRTETQQWTIILGVEKAGMSAQLQAWFTSPLGIPHVPLGGYASQTLVNDIRRYIVHWDRPAVLIYAGDHDATGEDIDRDLADRVGMFKTTERVALNPKQVAKHNLPQSVDPEVEAKLKRDPRAQRFRNRHGALAQYEMDALPPDTLRDLYRRALERYWDKAAYEAVLEVEASDRAEL